MYYYISYQCYHVHLSIYIYIYLQLAIHVRNVSRIKITNSQMIFILKKKKKRNRITQFFIILTCINELLITV